MAQTTDGFSGVDFKIEVSADNSAWSDISGSTNSVNPGDQTRMTGTTYTAQGKGAILTGGKLEPIELDVRVVATETTGEAAEVVRAAHEGTGRLYMRYSPKGGATGDFLYTTATADGTVAAGIVKSFTYPAVDAGKGDPVLCGFKIETPALKKTAISA